MTSSLVDTVTDLVKIPSVTGDENSIADYLEERLAETGRAVHRTEDTVVVGSPLPGSLLLVGHVDTVPPSAPNPVRLQDDRLHGLGACDMKGGVGVIVKLLEDPELLFNPELPNLIGVFYTGEEGPRENNSLVSTLDTYPWLQHADFGVLLEPSDNKLELGCNGSVRAQVTFSGRASHSARPWYGENAITKAGGWLDRLHQLSPKPIRIGDIEFKEVFSVTEARGGIAANIIPPEFILTLNYRFSPLRTSKDAILALQKTCIEADKVEITDIAPPGKVDPEDPRIQRMVEIVGSPPSGKLGWTDVATLSEFGISAVNFGPGHISQAHQAEEWVLVESLTKAYKTLKQFIYSF